MAGWTLTSGTHAVTQALEGEAAGAAQESFLRVHPDGELYLGMGFRFWVLSPQEARYVGGFGAAAWVPGSELLGA